MLSQRLGAGVAVATLVAIAVSLATVAGAAVPTESRNKIAATDDALVLLGRLVLPADAARSGSEPAGDGGTLAHPFSGPPITPNAIDDHAWWVLPEPPAFVLQYIQAHPPSGGRPAFSGTGTTGVAGQPTATGVGFAWPPIRGALSTRSLLVEVVALADGSTGVRADSQVVWITPRPAAERVPNGARRLVVTVTRSGRIIQGPLTITSPAAVRRVVALLNALPAAQPGVTSCPADFGSAIRLDLYTRAGAGPLAVATVDPSGCGAVTLTLGGRREPPLAGGFALARRLSRALGVKIDTGVPVP